MFDTIDYLKTGNAKQQYAYKAIKDIEIMDNLSEYNPILCGTLPIAIDTDISDLDIILEVYNFRQFTEKVEALFVHKKDFKIKKLLIRGTSVIKANFKSGGFEFELFGQPQPVKKQYAYLHMIIENSLMKQFSNIREEVIKLKSLGYKTEPAFCKVLGIKGDPYEKLIKLGMSKGIIKKNQGNHLVLLNIGVLAMKLSATGSRFPRVALARGIPTLGAKPALSRPSSILPRKQRSLPAGFSAVAFPAGVDFPPLPSTGNPWVKFLL